MLKEQANNASLGKKNNPLNPKIPRKNKQKSLEKTNIKNRGKWTNLSLPQCLLRKREIPLCGQFCGRCGQIPLIKQKQDNPNLKFKPLISQIYSNLCSGGF